LLTVAVSAVAAQDVGAPKVFVAFDDVRPVWDALAPQAPAPLAGPATDKVAAAWNDWVRVRDADIRQRVARGEEESLVNLWLFGTGFTSLPPIRPEALSGQDGGASLSEIADRRLADLLDALARPGDDDRARWAAQLLRQRGIDVPPTPAPRSSGQVASRRRAHDLLLGIAKRMVADDARYREVLEAPNPASDPLTWMLRYATLYQDRGLSSDTSILSSFAIESALSALAATGRLGHGAVRRVALVGPGLDVMNKAGGFDFYPEQTIQPFALIDSLRRHGLSAAELVVTTFDVSPRVNGHLAAALARASDGDGYVLQLPLARGEQWTPALEAYWARVGDQVGETVPARAVPPSARPARVRAVRVAPAVVRALAPRDVNVVLERLVLKDDDRFDLVVATNVLLYYEPFQQALALRNIGAMLRPGGSLLSNQAMVPIAPFATDVGHEAVVYSDRQFDHVFWYQRQ
jgi:SAM-dependent methyltransferase